MSTVQAVMTYSIVAIVLAVIISVCVVTRRLRWHRQDGTALDGDTNNNNDGVVVKVNPLKKGATNGAKEEEEEHAWHARATDASDLSWDRDDALHHVATMVIAGKSGLEDPRDTGLTDYENQVARPEDWLDENGGEAIWDRSDTQGGGGDDDNDARQGGVGGGRRALSPSIWMDQRQDYLSDDSASVSSASRAQKTQQQQQQQQQQPGSSVRQASSLVPDTARKGALRRSTTSAVRSAQSEVESEGGGLRRFVTAGADSSEERIKAMSQLMVRGVSIDNRSRLSGGAGGSSNGSKNSAGDDADADADEPSALVARATTDGSSV